MLEARIYVGLRDRDSHEQLFDTDRYKSVLKGVCKTYRTPFSVQVIEGGYFHDDGTWVDENTLLIPLIGAPRKTVYGIASDVCTLFHQESVMITCNKVVHFDVRDRKNPERPPDPVQNPAGRVLFRRRKILSIMNT